MFTRGVEASLYMKDELFIPSFCELKAVETNTQVRGGEKRETADIHFCIVLGEPSPGIHTAHEC
jgi:hypothetical protein